MKGEIAQIAAIACHANAFLWGKDTPKFFPGNSTTSFCDQITFIEISKAIFGKLRETPVAATPNEWFSYLTAQRAERILLTYQPQSSPGIGDRMAAAFVGGGGCWAMEVLTGPKTSTWIGRWEMWNQNAPENRIWRVNYLRVAQGGIKRLPRQDLHATRQQLLEALRDIHAFSVKHDCGWFSDSFAKALASLTEGAEHGYHRDIAPPGFLAPPANAILDACQSAWVFGGMGSWNDIVLEGQDAAEYDRVSERLFRTMMVAICTAINSAVAA